jgi:GT2 family glycosyltransferase
MSDAPMPAVSVVIVNWNGAHHIARCLEALEAQTFRNFEVIVVDNGSTDGSADLVTERFPTVRLLRQATNIGFAAGNNLGAGAARGTWLALLNNDAYAEPTWLEALQAVAGRDAGYVGFASCQRQAHRPEVIDGAGDAYHVSGVPWRLGFDHLYGPPWDTERDVFAPCACAAMYAREAFLAVGGFDERFFCYLEDVDLAFRLQLRSGRFRYVPQAVVNHVGSASTGKTSDFARYHGHRNMVWCYVKNMPTTLLWKYLPTHLAMNVGSLLSFTLRGEGAPIWRAKWDAVRGLPEMIAERRQIQRTRTASARELEGQMVVGVKRLLMRSRAVK